MLGWCSLAISLQCAKPPNNLQLVIYCGWVCTTRWVSRGSALAAWLLPYYAHSPPGPRRPPLQPSYHPPRAAAVPLPPSFPTNVSSGCIILWVGMRQRLCYYYSAVGRAAGGGGRRVAKPACASDRPSASRLPPATKP